MGHYVFNSISTDRTPCGSWTHRSGWTNSHQAKQKSWWSRNSASVLEGRRIIFLLQFLSRHRHPQMQSPTLHSVYLSIVSRRTETAWFWMAANVEDKNNSAAVYVGSSLIVHNPFFLHKLWQNKFISGFIDQKDLEKNNRNVKWPFRTKASKGKWMWMIVHLFHESLLHFIKSFYGAWSFLWEFVKSLECQINIYFLQTRLGSSVLCIWLYVPWLEKSQGMCIKCSLKCQPSLCPTPSNG